MTYKFGPKVFVLSREWKGYYQEEQKFLEFRICAKNFTLLSIVWKNQTSSQLALQFLSLEFVSREDQPENTLKLIVRIFSEITQASQAYRQGKDKIL